MKVFIRVAHSGEMYDQDCYAAYAGAKELGIPVEPYKAVYSIREFSAEDPVIGTFSDVKYALEQMGTDIPLLDYPPELEPFLGRRVWQSTLFTITSHPEAWHVFVKPVYDIRRFRGTVLDKSEDLIKLGGGLEDIDVWCSEKTEFLSEWRLWVLEGQPVGLTHYKGRWDLIPDISVLKQAVLSYTSAPSAYALDFGVTNEGKTLLVEVSDGYALSSYGLPPALYVTILSRRWSELTKK
ncbi:MAG: ATP-grasp domain-containing protein [Dialister sp.]|nr:ATP-grasp domain-containing protein [Dialister sp.]